MSQENVERVRESYEVFNRGGFVEVAEFWDPEIVWHTDPRVPEPGVYEGIEAVQTYFQGIQRAFSAFRIDVHEIIDLGGELGRRW